MKTRNCLKGTGIYLSVFFQFLHFTFFMEIQIILKIYLSDRINVMWSFHLKNVYKRKLKSLQQYLWNCRKNPVPKSVSSYCLHYHQFNDFDKKNTHTSDTKKYDCQWNWWRKIPTWMHLLIFTSRNSNRCKKISWEVWHLLTFRSHSKEIVKGVPSFWLDKRCQISHFKSSQEMYAAVFSFL